MVLAVESLSITYATPAGPAPAVRSVSFMLDRGETLGIVGESGSGKSTLAAAMIGYLAPLARHTGGRVMFRGEDLLAMPASKLATIRGRRIAIVHQNPQATLNPALRVGTQIAEVFRHHAGVSWRIAKERTVESLRRVNMPEPPIVARRYPHELSGGQRQRVAIAIALALDPDVLILDEPTTALDVTTEAVILDLLRDIKRRVGAAIVYISHNLGVIAQMADRVLVMYAGEVVEQAPAESLFLTPTHPYTRALLGCLVQPGASKRTAALPAIPGTIPRLTKLPAGCVFEPRCVYRASACGVPPPMQEFAPSRYVRCVRWQEIPALMRTTSPSPATFDGASDDTLLSASNVRKSFVEPGTAFATLRGRRVHAVAGVDLVLARNRVLGLVGESGSGKTTLMRCLAGLEVADAGSLVINDKLVAWPVSGRAPGLLRQLQVVFQDPESTLNPRHTVSVNLTRHLRALLPSLAKDGRRLLEQAMARVRLDPDYLDRYPAELSGGEKQRIAIARAFLGGPDAVLCDEPLSALDVSVQASILNLLLDLQTESKVSYLLISHDLAVVRYIADKIAVMYLGRIVEIGAAETFDSPPIHPYTEALLSAINLPDPRKRPSNIRLEGPPPSPADPPPGCVFHTRCPRKLGTICETTAPPWREQPNGRRYCCHIPPDELMNVQSAARSSATTAAHQ